MLTKHIRLSVIALGVWCLSAAAALAADSAPPGADPNSFVVAYYFHGNFRCGSCRTIQQYSEEAIESHFGGALKSGVLRYETVNVDESANRHFVRDYQLVTRSLIIVAFKDGKQVQWKNLSGVWQHLSNKGAFHDYVKREIETYLKDV
jgi:hypothetical protein